MPKSLIARTASTPSAAPRALVGERRVDEPVEQHPAPGVEQRGEALGAQLRAGGGVEQRLGARVDRQRRVLDERPDALGQLDAAGLAQELDVGARGPPAPGPARRPASSCRLRRGPRS